MGEGPHHDHLDRLVANDKPEATDFVLVFRSISVAKFVVAIMHARVVLRLLR